MVQTYSENTQIKQENDRSDDFVSPNSPQATYSQPSEFSVHGSLDMSSLGQTVWSLADQLRPLEEQGIHPLDSPFFFQSWTQQHYDHHEQECQAVRNEHSREPMPNQDNYIFTTMSTIMPPTPPVAPVTGLADDYPSYATIADFSPPRALTGSFSAPKLPISSRSSSTSSTHKSKTNTFNRRHSADVQRLHGARRSSAHPSVASVVSLTAHEPVAKVIDGIEHITFLYSHDRLVKEYTVRTDVESVNLDDVSINFRIQNAVSCQLHEMIMHKKSSFLL
jgi:hypothetical protein